MPVRIQRKRTKGWRKPEGAVYVGRGSKFGNPFRIGHSYPLADATGVVVDFGEAKWVRVGSAEGSVRLYSDWLADRIRVVSVYPQFSVAEVRLLRGKDLMCWCPLDQPCHADVLLRIANGL